MHLGHRSHFGLRYKLGCCGHAGLFCSGSEACICVRHAFRGNGRTRACVFVCVCALRGLAVFVTYLLVCALALLASPALLLEIAVWARDW